MPLPHPLFNNMLNNERATQLYTLQYTFLTVKTFNIVFNRSVFVFVFFAFPTWFQ